jgi:transposase-like protein
MVHPEHLKAAAMAALLAGESAHRVARRFDLPRTTVRRWRDQAWQSVQNGPQKRELSDQVQGFVSESIETQRAQLRAMMDPKWLRKHSARELAMLHGTVFDRMVGVVVSLEQGASRDG